MSHRDEIISYIQDVLFSRDEFNHTIINMDLTSIALHGIIVRPIKVWI